MEIDHQHAPGPDFDFSLAHVVEIAADVVFELRDDAVPAGGNRQATIDRRGTVPGQPRRWRDNLHHPLPVDFELDLDGQRVVQAIAPASGLTRDGASTIYRRLPVAAGTHRIVARLKDRASGDFNYVREVELELRPGRVLVIDFHADKGGFEFGM